MISSTFFFLFSQLGIGMLGVLLLISPRSIGPSFFKFSSSTAAVLLALTLGFEFLFPSPLRDSRVPVYLILVATVLAGVYNRTVHIGNYRSGMALLIAAVAVGMGAIIGDSLSFAALMDLGGWERWVLAVNHMGATLLLGSVMLTMVFGHWYLVVPKLSIDPIRLLTKVYIASIGVRVLTIMLTLVMLNAMQSIPFSSVAMELLIRQALFFWPRIIFGLLIPSILGFMIWRTLTLKHTQAATGLLYLAVVTLLFGEFFSKFLLFSLSLPL